MHTESYATSELETGESRGFTWFKVVGQNGKTFYFLIAPGQEIPKAVSFEGEYKIGRGFHPFEDGYLENASLMHSYLGMNNMDIEKWLDALIARPPECEISIHNDITSACLRFRATTFKKGRVEVVERKTDGKRDPIPQVAKLYAYFARNCPAPTNEQRSRIAISTIGSEILKLLKKPGLDMFRKWHDHNESKDETAGYYGYADHAIDDILIEAKGIRKVTFSRERGYRQILTKVEFADGHCYKEDQKGATTRIMGEYGEAIIAGAKDQALSKYIGLPGAENIQIRNSRADAHQDSLGKKSEHHMNIRSEIENVDLEIPTATVETDEQVMTDLNHLIGPNGYFKAAEAALAHHIHALDARDLLNVLSTLKAGHSVNLKDYGGPNVSLKSPGGHISQEYARPEPLKSPAEIYGATL